MTTALLSNDTALLQKAREVLIEKGFKEHWSTKGRTEYKSLCIYNNKVIRQIAMYSFDDPYCDTTNRLTPDNFDTVLSSINPVK